MQPAAEPTDPTPPVDRHPAASPPHPPSRHHRPRSSSSDEDDCDDDDAYGLPAGGRRRQPVFFPPLWLARRTECAHLVQSEGSRSVVDFGCGAGAVLSFLALPAYHRDEWPPAPSPSSSSSTITLAQHKQEQAALVASIPPPPSRRRGLHLSRLVGVDADLSACQAAVKACAPPPQRDGKDELRWDELRTEVWHGGVEVYNDALAQGVDAFIMTEVIEHLSESALSRVPNLLFSVYRPRLVVITTPNHAFNPYFPSPSSSASTSRPTWSRSADPPPTSTEEHPAHLFPDPTGRTKRVFRDDDHKLEWTPDEFRSWCADALRAAGAEGDYDVEYSGVGSLEAYYRGVEGGVPFPPPSLALHPELAGHPLCAAPIDEPQRFFATQIAVFRRRDGAASLSDLRATGEEQEQQDKEEEERVSRSLRLSPINSYSPLPPLDAPLAVSSPPPLCSATSTPRAPHALVAASTLLAHPAAALPPPSTAAERGPFRDAVRAAFCAARRGPLLSLEEVWRMGDRPLPVVGAAPTSSEDGLQPAAAHERTTEALRVLARGMIGAVVDALLLAEEDAEPAGEWGLERLRATREGAAELCGAEALGIRWERYDGFVEALERRERDEAERAWAERDGGTRVEMEEEADPASEVDELEGRVDALDVGAEQDEAPQPGWGAPSAGEEGSEGGSAATHAGWGSSAPAMVTTTTTSSWGEDPW
ncbi:hypothetical protein JCM9279_005193 [Rhodotorula babjevae]